jgi:hypothetical protein
LPILHSVNGAACYLANNIPQVSDQQEKANNIQQVSDKPENLMIKQRTILRWHHRLAHMNFQKLHDLAR